LHLALILWYLRPSIQYCVGPVIRAVYEIEKSKLFGRRGGNVSKTFKNRILLPSVSTILSPIVGIAFSQLEMTIFTLLTPWCFRQYKKLWQNLNISTYNFTGRLFITFTDNTQMLESSHKYSQWCWKEMEIPFETI